VGLKCKHGETDFSLLQAIQAGCGAYRVSCLVGVHVLFLRIMWLCCEDDHSPPSSAKFKNVWSCTSAPPICRHGLERDDFIID
jgi:hypothetical protein